MKVRRTFCSLILFYLWYMNIASYGFTLTCIYPDMDIPSYGRIHAL